MNGAEFETDVMERDPMTASFPCLGTRNLFSRHPSSDIGLHGLRPCIKLELLYVKLTKS